MRIFENYLVLFISMLGMILADSDDGTWFCSDTQLSGNNIKYNITKNITEHQQFFTELLDLHNEYRAKHSAGKLVLDKKVSNYLFH